MTFAWLDKFWERVKTTWPQLQLWDQTYDQSHLHHTLVCLLGFGSLGMLLGGSLMGFGWWVFGGPLALGVHCGWLFYIIREILNRVGNWTYNLWDGVLDVLVPVFILGPVTLFPGHWSQGLIMFVLGAVVAWMYSFGRPGILHYDKTKD